VGALAAALGTEVVFGAVPAVGAALAVWVLRTPARRLAAPEGGGALAAMRRSRIQAGMWLVALPAVCFGVITVLVPLRMSHLGAGSAAVAAMFLAAGAMEALVSPAIGRLSDRRGRLVPVRAGLLLSAPLLLVLAWPQRALLLAALVVLATGALGTFWAPAIALLSDTAAGAGMGQGVAFALTNLAWAAGNTAGAIGGGALAAALTDAVPYALLAALCVVTFAALRQATGASRSTRARQALQ
jgi:predicted MFS family arabinose efflux permease